MLQCCCGCFLNLSDFGPWIRTRYESDMTAEGSTEELFNQNTDLLLPHSHRHLDRQLPIWHFNHPSIHSSYHDEDMIWSHSKEGTSGKYQNRKQKNCPQQSLPSNVISAPYEVPFIINVGIASNKWTALTLWETELEKLFEFHSLL